jgi:membrane protease YdiL (CAAX protease family)
MNEENVDKKPVEVSVNQYNLLQIFAIWLGAGIPMWVLGWLVYPSVSEGMGQVEAAKLRFALMAIGLVWQFVLSMIILYREEGNIRIQTIRKRFWLNNPVSPSTGKTNKKLWWWLLPFGILLALCEGAIGPVINAAWVKLLPIFAEPAGYAAQTLFTTDLKLQFIGDWGFFILIVVMLTFNTFLGEEFIFRGILLPKMKGVFGKWDWVANGVGFACYHLHQPWMIPSGILAGLVFAFTGKKYHSNWFPIILHSFQSVLMIFMILGLVLGLA